MVILIKKRKKKKKPTGYHLSIQDSVSFGIYSDKSEHHSDVSLIGGHNG